MRIFCRKSNELRINSTSSPFDVLEKMEKIEKVRDLLQEALLNYERIGCQCGFPRFRQIVSIDCVDTGQAFQSLETELLIDLSKKKFHIDVVDNKGVNYREIWICKKCKSQFEYLWSDFSIAINRQCLKPIELKINNIGKDKTTTIPLFVGLIGHSYPSKDLIIPVNYSTFRDYILEKK